MRKKWRLAIVAVAALATMAGTAVAREPMVGDARIPYSAVRTVTLDGKTYSGKVFHEPGKERLDQSISGIELNFILDLEASAGFIVVPSLNSYVPFHPPALLAELNRSRLKGLAVGEERIAGMRATKYRIDYTASDGVHGDGFIWLGDDNILLRIDGRVERKTHKPMTIRMELSDIRPGPQNPALFNPPAGMKPIPEEALQTLLSLTMKLPKGLKLPGLK